MTNFYIYDVSDWRIMILSIVLSYLSSQNGNFSLYLFIELKSNLPYLTVKQIVIKSLQTYLLNIATLRK